MAIDIATEQHVSLKDAPAVIPGRPHISTVFRWTQRARDPLETFKCGGRTFTTREAITRFIAKCSDPGAVETSPTKRRRRDIATAEAELAAAGIE